MGEDLSKELKLKDASRDEILDALVAHPELIERPIVISGDGQGRGRPTAGTRARPLLAECA